MKTTYKLQQTNRDRDNSRHVRTHEKNLLRCVRRLGTIIQSIFCAQSGAGIRLNFWKWSVESRYPGALSPVIKTFVPSFLPTRLTAPGSPRMGLGVLTFYQKWKIKHLSIYSTSMLMCEFLLTVVTCTVLLPYSYWFIFTSIKFHDFQFNTCKQKIVQNLNV